MRFKINFDGLLRSPSSWAKVNRELLKALARRDDVDLAVQPRRGFNWERSFDLDPVLTDRPRAHDHPDATLTFTFPPLLDRDRPSEGHHLLMSLYEATRLPPDWVEPLRCFEGTILVPSRHVARIYDQDGVNSNRIQTIPYGYNPEVYHPGADTGSSDKITLLSIGTPHYRKGLDYLLDLADLAERDSIEWKVHSTYRPDSDGDFWEDPGILSRLEDRGFHVSVESLSEDEMAELYRDADLVVQPSRSEGFGLVALEAMASECPAVTTNWGGFLEFAGSGMIQIDGIQRSAGRAQYHRRRPGAEVFDADPLQLRLHLRELIEDPQTLEALGRKAHRTAEPFTWDRTAARTMEALRDSETYQDARTS
jgi:glycosyltransferase involved in cell wall biosynthesis